MTVSERDHYQPGNRHRGFPLGGGSINPAAKAQQRQRDEDWRRWLADALDESGRHEEYEAIHSDLVRERERLAAACLSGPWPASTEAHDAARAKWDAILNELRALGRRDRGGSR